MYALARLDGIEWWHVAGWTMLHFLWLGALAGIVAGVCRLVLRRAPANVRYAVAIVCLAVLAALPAGIAVWVNAKPPETRSAESFVVALPVETIPATPGSAGGLTRALSAERAAASTPIVSHDPATIRNPIANPRQSRGLTDMFALVAGYLPWAWVVGTPLTFILLATGVVGAERLRRTSRAIDEGPIAEACARIVESLRIGRQVTVAVCERIASPVLVGIVRPIILLPPAALTGWSPDEIEMVLLHELAHVRRWDNLVNLMQRFVESLLFFHPAVWLVSSWVRTEREACCDAVVVSRTNRPREYAELLVELAAFMSEPSEPGRPRPRFGTFTRGRGRPGSLVSSMAAGPLKSRIRRILGLQDDPMLISGKSLGVVMGGLLLVVTLATLNLPLNGQAKEPTAGDRPDDVAEALDAFRKAVVGYDLDFDSVFPRRGWRPYDAKRLERYPTSDAWPDVLGHVDSDAGKFRTVSNNLAENNETVHETVTGGNAYLVPVDWNIGTKDYATLLLMRGLAADAHIVAHSYTSFASFGTLAGDVLFKSYATALVDGDMSGQIAADSYFNLVVTGKFTGRIFTGSYAMIYLMGGFDGDMELENSKVFIAGRTPSAALNRIQGAGHVFLELSDLAAGENKIGELQVTVGKSVQPPAEVQMRQQIAQVEATNQLKYLALALHVYHDAKGALPAVASFDAQGRPLLSWRVQILPYLDGNATGGGTTAELYKEFHLDEPWDSEHNRKLIPRMPAVFRNPTGALGAETRLTNYLAVMGPDCVFDGSAKGIKFSQIPDGTSNTVMVVEADEAVEWTKPDDFHFNPAMPKAGLGRTRMDSWIAALADGSIQLIEWDEPDEKVRDMFTCGRKADPLELPTSGPESTPQSAARSSAKFPTLEDQKLADAAYRRLGFELEAVGDEDQKRVKALGYDGGLLVTANNGQTISWNEVNKGDILVGLHVWPTSSIQELLAVLNREDLAELDPLKYYIVRSKSESDGGFGLAASEPKDIVVSGRISVPPAVLSPSPVPQPAQPFYAPQPVLQPVQGLPVPTIPNAVEPISRIPTAQAPMAQIVIDPREIALDPNLQGPKPERWLTPPELAAPAPDPLTESEKRQLKAAGGVRIEFYYHPDSEPCTKAAKLVPKYEKEFAGLVKVERINVAENPAAAKAADVDRVPTFKLYLGERSVMDRTGEMTVEQLDSTLCSIARHEAMVPTVSMVKQPPELRYAGKTFDQWRTIWQTELSLERRLEVVKALAAFGASGKGPEAAQAILDVANQLDWTSVDFNAPSGKLKQGCIDAFTTGQSTEGYRIPVKDWWPLVVPIYENSPEKSTIVTYLSYQLPAGEKELIPKLLELSDRDEATRKLAMEGLRAVDPGLTDERVMARLRRTLQDPKAPQSQLWWAMSHLLSSSGGNSYGGGMGGGGRGPQFQLRMVPELQPLLFHPEHLVRQQARFTISNAQPKDAAALVEQLKQRIDMQDDGRERKEAIRALAALGQRATPAEDSLKAIALNPKDSARIPAAAALLAMWPDIANWGSDEKLNKLFGPGTTDQTDSTDLLRKLETEQQEIFGVYTQSPVGGGGGMF